MRTLRETYRGVAFPWLCDSMGHLATQHYMAMFDVASFHFLSSIGPPLRELADAHRGWADVHHEIDYTREVRAGEIVLIRSTLLEIGTRSVRYRHLMLGEDDSRRAVMTVVTVHLDLTARKAVPLPLIRNDQGVRTSRRRAHR